MAANLHCMVHDVDETSFEKAVLERSHELPVVVDFWAEWCGPCRQLTPALEGAAGKRTDDVELAKVDVDANQNLAASFGVRGIPAVKAFRDGQVVAEFTGAIPPAQVEAFFDRLVPSEADRLAETGDETSLRAALAADPRHALAAVGLGRLLIARDEYTEAAQILERFPGDFNAEGLTARARLCLERPDDELLSGAFAAWDRGEHETALERLQEAFASTDDEQNDAIRQVLVALFTELGADHPLAREHRRRLAAALN